MGEKSRGLWSIPCPWRKNGIKKSEKKKKNSVQLNDDQKDKQCNKADNKADEGKGVGSSNN